MNKNIFAIVLFLITALFVSCNSCCTETIKTSNNGNTETNITEYKLPDNIVCDSSFLDGCVSYSSKNMKIDLSVNTNVYPFVVKDSIGSKSMFVLFTTNRYDKLYISQMNITDSEDYAINTNYVSNIKTNSKYESMLFYIDNKDYDFLIRPNGNIKVNVWGLFGSMSVKLDSIQTKSFSELAEFAKN